jgi:hypothetical protein
VARGHNATEDDAIVTHKRVVENRTLRANCNKLEIVTRDGNFCASVLDVSRARENSHRVRLGGEEHHERTQ